ncbi:DUF4447 family protein [Oligella urethralis]|uniref:HTH cro/C1-type domain-containing protein n=1 Tax=Oligella urethralis TaxID=90245 RepID=A0A2X1WHS7_9BURK|nr:DUF4447 family protein [Oligella urethralis]SPY08184.1 Uncharacterised protein [Oligella urethralis]
MKELRESLGLSTEWLAKHAGLSINEIQQIESGEKAAPQVVIDLLKQIDGMIDNSVNQATEQIAEAERLTGTLPEQLDLVRYNDDVDLWHYQPEFKPLPATCHAALINRLMDKIKHLHIPIHLVWLRPHEYETWLNGREDSQKMRAMWASEQEL